MASQYVHMMAMNSATLLLQWLALVFLIASRPSTPLSASPHRLPRLSTHLTRKIPAEIIPSASVSADLQTFLYNQTLDHFNYRPESYATFQQRYVIDSRYWGGANTSAPIFAYLGEEVPIEADIAGIGFLTDNAPWFNAFIVYIEHRYYGESVPFGTQDEAMKNESLRGYFNSAQALADYAEVLLHLKKNLSAENSPIIVIGGSYGGMLASWFRLKYPHIALGALASSAPILYFDNITPSDAYYKVVTKDYKEASESCYETIRASWSQIEELASRANGLSILSKKFKTCAQLNQSSELKDYLIYMYSYAAQYDEPPTYPVTTVCSGIDGASTRTGVLDRIFAGVVSYKGNKSCYDTNEYNYPTQTTVGFTWQDIKRVLHKFASNIIFSNGLRDPYSSGGVLENISDTVVAVYTVNGSHGLDIFPAKPSDPEWLITQRKREVKIIQGWLKKYYADLVAFRQ